MGEGRGRHPRHCGTGAQVHRVYLLSCKSQDQQLPETPVLSVTEALGEGLIQNIGRVQSCVSVFPSWEHPKKISGFQNFSLPSLIPYLLWKSHLGQQTAPNAVSLMLMLVLGQWFSDLSIHQKHLEDSLTQSSGPHSQSFWFTRSWVGLGIGIPNKLPRNAEAAGPGSHFENHCPKAEFWNVFLGQKPIWESLITHLISLATTSQKNNTQMLKNFDYNFSIH